MHTCPVCAYPKLHEAPHAPSGGGSYEICPSCGFQFGVDDDDKGMTYDQARDRWIKDGMKWSSLGMAQPKAWDAKAQLAGLKANAPTKKAAKKN